MGRVLVLFAVLASLVASASAEPAATAAPALRLVKITPLTLRGTSFRARERVRVTLTIRSRAWRSTLTTNARGAFTYRPAPFVVTEPCRGTILVTALGLNSRLRAAWKRACRPPDEWPASVAARRGT